MEDHRQSICHSLESLILGQVYTAPVSIETVLAQWIANTKFRLSLHGAPCSKISKGLRVDFELPFDKSARDRPIICYSVNPAARTWAGCVFYTLEEIRDSGKVAKQLGLRVRDFKKLLARTGTSKSTQFADLLINVEHHPKILWPNHQGFNGKEGNPGFYMFCLPAVLPFPQNGGLKLYLPQVACIADNLPAYPRPTFIVDPVTFGNICNHVSKAKRLLEEIIKSSFSKKDGGSFVEGARDRGILESSGNGEAMEIDSNEEIGGGSACTGKRKREDNGGESPRKRKINCY